MIDFDDMKAFLALAEELSFTRAALRLHVAQPPFTRRIARMEGRLGVRLFERTTRSVRLTEAGRLLVGEARDVLARAEAVGRRLRDATCGRSGWLGVGHTPLALFTVLPRLLDHLRRAAPGFDLQVRQASTRQQVAALAAGEIDLGLVHLPVPSPHLATRTLHTERMRLAVPAAHPAARARHARLADFAGEPFIVHPPQDDPAMHEDTLRCCAAAGFAPKLRRVGRQECCMGLILAGHGVHFVAPGTACLRLEGVAYLDLVDPAPTVGVALAWRRGSAYMEEVLQDLQAP